MMFVEKIRDVIFEEYAKRCSEKFQKKGDNPSWEEEDKIALELCFDTMKVVCNVCDGFLEQVEGK